MRQTYDKVVIPRLVSTLLDFFELNPALQVLISATIRNEETFEIFLKACSGYRGISPSRKTPADFCGAGRNGISLEQIDFPPVPEDLQNGPFFPTSVPILLCRLTKHEEA